MILYIFILFCIFVIGTLFGSFFSLAIYRLPRHQDIVIKRSYCPTCKHNLGFFDLIPILSYIFCGGKCRYCKEKISARYLLLELSNGIIFVLFFLIFGYTLNFLIVAIVYAITFVLLGSAIMKRKISDEEKKKIQKDNIKNKKGVFISEIIIAMVLFTLLLASSFVISRNYNKKSRLTIARSNAVQIGVRNIEYAKATEYSKLISSSTLENINGTDYITDIVVTDLSAVEPTYKEDVVKKIVVNVKYNLDGKEYSFSIKTLKGGNIK